VMICYGVLKNRQPFDPDWASKKPTVTELGESVWR